MSNSGFGWWTVANVPLVSAVCYELVAARSYCRHHVDLDDVSSVHECAMYVMRGPCPTL